MTTSYVTILQIALRNLFESNFNNKPHVYKCSIDTQIHTSHIPRVLWIFLYLKKIPRTRILNRFLNLETKAKTWHVPFLFEQVSNLSRSKSCIEGNAKIRFTLPLHCRLERLTFSHYRIRWFPHIPILLVGAISIHVHPETNHRHE